jgi:phosphomannomutase
MNRDDTELSERTRAWIEGDPDAETRAELERLLKARDFDELRARMSGPLAFGTAGLRAPVGAGSGRMNRATVIRTTRGLAEFLAARRSGARSLPVIVGSDARPSSPALAREVVAVLAAARIPVRWFPEPVPTPLVAYAARVLEATAAIVITASHNPREDNGYKLYLDDAIQLVSPHDRGIEAAIQGVGPALAVPRLPAEQVADAPAPYRPEAAPLATAELFERYLSEVAASLGPRAPDAELRIAYTPLHGVGGRFVRRAFAYAGYADLRVVPEQAEPDGSFPTTPFPNPEEPGTLELGLRFAEREGADLLLANDPDADRLAAAVPTPSGRFVRLSGNQLAVLLADARLAAAAGPRKPIAVTSIVTTPLVEAVARSYGARFERTLTGFKWIWSAALELERTGQGQFAYACEEALGYSVTPAVRDKDGIAAALALADLASACRARGQGLLDRLNEIERKHGVSASVQRSVRLGAREREAALAALDRLVSAPPGAFGGSRLLAVHDYRTGGALRPRWLPDAELVEFELEGGRVLVRPSGTEPKLKIYVDWRAAANSPGSLSAQREALLEVAGAASAELLEKLGLVCEDDRR